MSLRTSRWDFPQNEQDRLTWCSFFTATSEFARAPIARSVHHPDRPTPAWLPTSRTAVRQNIGRWSASRKPTFRMALPSTHAPASPGLTNTRSARVHATRQLFHVVGERGSALGDRGGNLPAPRELARKAASRLGEAA